MANTVKVEVLATVKMTVSVPENDIDSDEDCITTAIRIASRDIDQKIVAIEAKIVDR